MLENLSLLWVTPFVLLILAIAVLPPAFPVWWRRSWNQALVALIPAAPVAIYLGWHAPAALVRSLSDYVPFIALLASLYVVSGGILLEGDLKATPGVNTAFLGVGAILANLVGTTAASMLLIRPLLRTNRPREHTRHIPIFFIFLVSNIGGCLTPIGPPLFLGYLRGIPFFWTLRLFPAWLFMVASLLAIFYVLDSRMLRREPGHAPSGHPAGPLRLRGAHNLIPLGGIVLAVLAPARLALARPVVMGLFAILSHLTTPQETRRENRVSHEPMLEVAILFAGIFITLAPVLVILGERGRSLGITHPWEFFWLSGGLSSVLDNAPAYLAFGSLALGVGRAAGHAPSSFLFLVRNEGGQALLRAVSLGCVFMGANTYIGNAPNFMVKSIAEERKIPMPSFFGYMAWSAAVLGPLFVLMTLLFLR